MTLAVTAELSAWLAARVARFTAEASERDRWLAEYVATYQALPVSVGSFQTIGLRPDGEFVIWSPEGYWSGAEPVDERSLWMWALFVAVERYPELRALIPARTASAKDCGHLSEPGFVESRMYCPMCGGLGWVEA